MLDVKLKESNKNIYVFTEDYIVPKIKDTDIVFGNKDIAICFVRETNTKYVYFPDKDIWTQWDFYEDDIERLFKSNFSKNQNVDNIPNNFKGLLFEIYSAGFEAGMQDKDIVSSYNDFYEDILRRLNS